MPRLAYLSLGSNLGERKHHLREAITRLEAAGRIASVSSFYETEPVEIPIEIEDQPWFLNCAVTLETTQLPEQLMQTLLAIEQEMGRVRTRAKGPRMIDLDILLLDDLIIDSPSVTIPHPSMQHRRFVLEPLAELAGEVRHPVLQKTVRQLLDELPPGQAVHKI